MHILKRTTGVSIMELAVSLGVLSVLVLTVGAAFKMSLKSATTSSQMVEETYLTKEAQSISSSPNLCTSALIGTKSVVGGPAIEVSLTPKCSAGSQGICKDALYDGKINLSSVAFQNVTAMGTGYQADVVISGTKLGEVYGNSLVNRTVRVFYTVDASNKLLACMGSWNTDAATNCNVLGGNWVNGHCDFCQALGGSVLPDGTCTVPTSGCSMPAGTAWSVNNAVCTSDTGGTILNNGQLAVTDSGAPTTGTATFTCSNGTLSLATNPPATCISTVVTPPPTPPTCASTPLIGSSSCSTNSNNGGCNAQSISGFVLPGGGIGTYSGSRDWAEANASMFGLTSSDISALSAAEQAMSNVQTQAAVFTCAPIPGDANQNGTRCTYSGSSGHVSWQYIYRWQTCSNTSDCGNAYQAVASASVTFSCN